MYNIHFMYNVYFMYICMYNVHQRRRLGKGSGSMGN